jgi:acyl-coenzyme A synthetase/AMP-(fatty) acid ligase
MSEMLAAIKGRATHRDGAVALATAADAATCGELVARSESLVTRLRRHGGAGARLAIVVTDPVETLVAVLAAQALGATALLLSAAAPQREVTRLVERFGGEVVLDGGRVSLVARGRRAAGEVPREPGLALATSGVSGPPKVAQRDWDSVVRGALALAEATELGAGDVLLCTTPLHHAYSFVAGLVACILTGATYVAPPAPVSPATLADLCVAHGVTILFSVPALYRWYLEGPPLRRPLRLAVSAGEELSAGLIETWRELHGGPLCNHYGSTELGMLTFEPEGVAGSAGRPLPGVEIEVAAAPGEVGEVIARGAGRPALLLDVRDGARHDVRMPAAFPTGDLGRLGEDGRLYLTGRTGTTINLGGQKIAPAEVEAAIRDYGPVRECAVISVAVARGAPRLCAVIEADEGFDPSELRARLLGELAPYKVPTTIRRVRELPRTSTGKLARAELAGDGGG